MDRPAKTVYYWTGGMIDAYDEDHQRVCVTRDYMGRPQRTDIVSLIRHLTGRKGVRFMAGECKTSTNGKKILSIALVPSHTVFFWNWIKKNMPEKYVEAGVVL
jgi:hypothetical protein